MSTSASDLYQQYAGVLAINSGPIVIRTYNDLSGNNTYLLGKYDIPISSNYVLITSTGGKLVPSNAIYVSSITVSSLTAISSNISTLNVSTLTAISSNVSTLHVSSLTAISSNISTLNVSTFTASGGITTSLSAMAPQETSGLISINSVGILRTRYQSSWSFLESGTGFSLSPSLGTYITSGVYILTVWGAGSASKYVAIISWNGTSVVANALTLIGIALDAYSSMFTLNNGSIQWNYSSLSLNTWTVNFHITPLVAGL